MQLYISVQSTAGNYDFIHQSFVLTFIFFMALQLIVIRTHYSKKKKKKSHTICWDSAWNLERVFPQKKMAHLMSQNYETNSVTVVNLVSDLQHSDTVFAL